MGCRVTLCAVGMVWDGWNGLGRVHVGVEGMWWVSGGVEWSGGGVSMDFRSEGGVWSGIE